MVIIYTHIQKERYFSLKNIPLFHRIQELLLQMNDLFLRKNIFNVASEKHASKSLMRLHSHFFVKNVMFAHTT